MTFDGVVVDDNPTINIDILNKILTTQQEILQQLTLLNTNTKEMKTI